MSAPVFGLGPLERYLADPAVTEVMINGGRELWVEWRGRPPHDAGVVEPDAGAPQRPGHSTGGPVHVGDVERDVVDVIIERVLAPVGRRLDRVSPVVDARLPDGSRVCAVIPPVAVDGPCLTIRKFGVDPVPLSAFATPPVVALLADAVRARCNVLVSGATSAGKTTLLNGLAAAIHASDRVITLEDTAELRLEAHHVLRLETRPASPDGAPAIDLAALLRAALRLRPDRLVIGEIRGDEAVDLVQALNTGHDGSLATVHANGPADALARLESLVVRAAAGWPLVAVREQIRRSVDVVVHVQRDATGARRIDQVVEVGHEQLRALVHRGSVVAPLERRRR